MDLTSQLDWHPRLLDPTGQRNCKPRIAGKTMVIDKGLGLHAFEDLLQTAGSFIDILKIGFGTSPLYPQNILKKKIALAKAYDICIVPGGTFLEIAIAQDTVNFYFNMIRQLGFEGIEVSDGTIEVNRSLRNELIARGVQEGLTVFTEYGKKTWGSAIEMEELFLTVELDIQYGANLVTIEGRESGVGVGVFDENGECKKDEIAEVARLINNHNILMWEAPQKNQQVYLIKTLGPETNLGNISPADILSLEALRRGLRSDTMGVFRT